MPRINETLTFDGSATVADQFSNNFVRTGTTTSSQVAFVFDVDVATGPFAITLQVNADASDDTGLGWNDVSTPDMMILNMTTSELLDQTDSSIEGGAVRGGIIKADSNYGVYLFEFMPLAATYRLRFQIAPTTVATINQIYTVP